MLSTKDSWTPTLVLATAAVAFALAGLGLTSTAPGAAPLLATSLLVASLGATASAFAFVAMRVRRLELENEGLVEEIAQEFRRVQDRMEIFGDALAEPRTLTPEVVEEPPLRRVTVK
ncbi:MAG TPA: hypothetical protein VHH36_06840 [Candidatus Thermoplasmatota archaeon]|nr:hypothetical protein [Candidatus Thermoplasmatota archaeon]